MDFGALASRMAAGLEGVRACLVVSGDGLSLGAHPEHSESQARERWDRLSALGDPQRGFFVFGDELWVVARQGWYSALVVASPSVKPGVALDRLEAYLRTADEARVREAPELTGAPPLAPEASRRLRTPLHREVRPPPHPLVQPAVNPPAPVPPPVGRSEPETGVPRPHWAAAAPDPRHPPGPSGEPIVDMTGTHRIRSQVDARAPARPPAEAVGGAVPRSAEEAEGEEVKDPARETEVDRVALTQEFSKLFGDFEDRES